MNIRKYIVTDAGFYKKTFALIVPVILQSLISQGVNAMDTVMVGQLGEVSISASSMANQYYLVFLFTIMGVCASGTVLISQYYGAKELGTLHRVFDTLLQMAFLVAVFFTIITAVFPTEIMRLYTDDADVIREGAEYLRITSMIFLPHAFSLVIIVVLRAVGNAKLSLFSTLCSFAVNIFCNYIFIFGKLGFPAMGVKGAALGTLCARVVEFLACLFYLLRFEHDIRYRFKTILHLPNTALLKEFLRLGLPAFISDTLTAFGFTGVSMIIGHMGRTVISAYAIVSVIEGLCCIIGTCAGGAAGYFIGLSVGAGEYARAEKESWTLVLLSTALGMVSGIILLIAGPPALTLYKVSTETAAAAQSMIYVGSVMAIFMAIQLTLGKGILRSSGDTRFMMVADIIFQFCLSIPLGYVAGILLNLPAAVVFFCLRIDYIAKTVLLLARLRSNKWIHRVKLIDT